MWEEKREKDLLRWDNTLPVNIDKQRNNLLEAFVLLNIQGLYPESNQTKIKYLEDIANINKYLMLAITETHLNEDIKK